MKLIGRDSSGVRSSVCASTLSIMNTIRIFHECVVLIEKSVPKVTVGHHEALPSDAKLNTRDRFVDRYLKLIIDSLSCTPMGADASFYSHLTLK